MRNEIIKLGKLEVNLNELTNFLVEAKKKGFAGGGVYKMMVDGSKQFSCQRGNFHYTDRYSGSYQFSGTEIVSYGLEDAQRIWQMNYFGGVLPEFLEDEEIVKQAESVLRPALIRVPLEAPFRGPREYNDGIKFYINNFRGDIKRFGGEEEIRLKKVDKKYQRADTGLYRIFSLWYHGGLIVPK